MILQLLATRLALDHPAVFMDEYLHILHVVVRALLNVCEQHDKVPIEGRRLEPAVGAHHADDLEPKRVILREVPQEWHSDGQEQQKLRQVHANHERKPHVQLVKVFVINEIEGYHGTDETQCRQRTPHRLYDCKAQHKEGELAEARALHALRPRPRVVHVQAARRRQQRHKLRQRHALFPGLVKLIPRVVHKVRQGTRSVSWLSFQQMVRKEERGEGYEHVHAGRIGNKKLCPAPRRRDGLFHRHYEERLHRHCKCNAQEDRDAAPQLVLPEYWLRVHPQHKQQHHRNEAIEGEHSHTRNEQDHSHHDVVALFNVQAVDDVHEGPHE
eukprot:PhM_4_TR11670/c0_g1_i1/m.13338